jgi:quinol monooxygenase YgiN
VYVLELACFRADPRHAAALLRCAAPLLTALRERFPGVRKLQLARISDGRWLQVGFWEDRNSAEAAAREMFDLPEMSDWLAQVGEYAETA